MSYIDDLVKIKELLDSGVLSQDEYDSQKQKILDLSYKENEAEETAASSQEDEAFIEQAPPTDEANDVPAEEAGNLVEESIVPNAEGDVTANDRQRTIANDSYEANKPNYQIPSGVYSANPEQNSQWQQNFQPQGQQQYNQNPQMNQSNTQQYGQGQQGSNPYGQSPYGQQQYGQSGYGQPGYGQPPYGQQNNTPIQKSKVAAGILGIFLGFLGIHNFYLGFTTKAIIQLLLSVLLGWAFLLGVFIAGIWGLIEGILILVGNISADAKGVPLRE